MTLLEHLSNEYQFDPLLQQAMSGLIRSHLSTSSHVPIFCKQTEDLVDYMVNHEITLTNTDAIVEIENTTSENSKFSVDDWYVEYDNLLEGWTFRKKQSSGEIGIRIREHNSDLIERIKAEISYLSPREFEDLIYILFSSLDEFDHSGLQPQSHDGGYELFVRSTDRITGHRDWILIQAKHQKGPVTVGQVRELIGTLNVETTRRPERHIRGLMISIIPPSEYALKVAKQSSMSIEFLDVESIARLLEENNLGVRKQKLTLNELDLGFWSDFSGENHE